MISVIIPTLNEAENIAITLEQVQQALKDFEHELVVIDDNSEDKTAEVAKECAIYSKLIIIVRKERRDLSKSIKEGFKHAKGEIILVMDADQSHDPSLIPNMLKQLDKKTDIVIGSRLMQGGRVEDWPWHRRLVSIVGRNLARPLTSVSDPMSGFFIIRKKVLNNGELTPLGYKILLEILVKGNYKRIKEIPITFKTRKKGTSKLNLTNILKFLIHILKLYLHIIYKPIKKHY